VLLLEECMMLLQRQGDKYLLKFHSSASSQAPQGSNESKRHFHSPIIKVLCSMIFLFPAKYLVIFKRIVAWHIGVLF
jgi:hypothetical protein